MSTSPNPGIWVISRSSEVPAITGVSGDTFNAGALSALSIKPVIATNVGHALEVETVTAPLMTLRITA